MSEKVEPVRVKMYGLVPMTRGRYLSQLFIAFLLAILLLLLWYFRWPEIREQLVGVGTPLMLRVVAFWDTAPWMLLIIGVIQGIEFYFVMRAFARKEAERKQAAVAGTVTSPDIASPTHPAT